MKKLLGIGILGSWPLWVAVVWVIAGSVRYENSQGDYWNAAPWIIFASIPVCIATTILALVANRVFHRTEGAPLRKFTLAALVYLSGLVLLGLYWRSKW